MGVTGQSWFAVFVQVMASGSGHQVQGSYLSRLWLVAGAIRVKTVQSALSDLKRPQNVYSPSAIISLSLLNSILVARFLKQSFAQTCLKETGNGKLQQFNYSRSMITNQGTSREEKFTVHVPITMTIAMAKWEFLCLKTKQSYS